MVHAFEFNIAERHIGQERGCLRYSVTTPKSGKRKETCDVFESSNVDAIAFWDDPRFKPGRGPNAAH